jgi:type I restriction enzyme, R subunit
MNEAGETVIEKDILVDEPQTEMEETGPLDKWLDQEGEQVKKRKYYVDHSFVEISAHLVQELDEDGKQLRVVKFSDYTAEKVRNMYPSAAMLRSAWGKADERTGIIESLKERGIEFDELARTANQPDADPFDLLCHIAFNAPLRTRRERAEDLRKSKKDFFDRYSPDARGVLTEMLDKYIEYSTAQFQVPEILKIPPISERGTVTEIAALFGGAEKMRAAVNEMQALLYAS